MKFKDSHNLPAPIKRAIEWQSQAHSVGKANRSCTTLIDSPLIWYLWKVYGDQVEVEYASRLWALFGTLAHLIIEKFGGEEGEEHIEQKVYAPFGDWVVSGQIDYIHAPKRLIDYKFTSTYAASEVKVEWENQANTYLGLMRHSDDPKLRALANQIEELQICAMLRDWGPRHKAEFPCQIKMLDVPVWDSMKGVEAESIPLWTDVQTVRYIRERIELHRDAEQRDVMPPMCSEQERWVKAETFKIIKPGRKSSLKNFNIKDYANAQEAEAAAINYCNSGTKGVTPDCEVQLFKSEPRRCIDYCDVSGVCPYYEPTEAQQEEW